MALIAARQVAMGVGSGSTNTGPAWYVGDFRLLTVSFQSAGSLGASRFTVQGSNADGFQASDLGGPTSLAGWSLVSGVNIVGEELAPCWRFRMRAPTRLPPLLPSTR